MPDEEYDHEHDATSGAEEGGSTPRPKTPEEKRALDELVERIYARLKPLAARVRWRDANASLSPTTLVQEAYLKLLNSKDVTAKPHEEVIGIFAHVMRQIMIDAARRKKSQKRGSGALVPLSPVDPGGNEPPAQKKPMSPEDLLTIEAALEDLRRGDSRQADIIERRFYLGMTVEETATILQLSRTTVEREERKAKKFLENRIRPPQS